MSVINTVIPGGEVHKMVAVGATIIRCGCGNPAKIHPGRVCPSPLKVEDKGVVSYAHRRWYKRFWFWFRRDLLGQTVKVENIS